MIQVDSNDCVVVIVLLIVTVMLTLFLPKLRKRAEWLKEVRDERDTLLATPVPEDIQQSVREYCSGAFVGEDQSPLAYIRYRVGIARGLPQHARQTRLSFCFRTEMPADLPSKYKRWGRPATLCRFASIERHLSMLADQRRGRPNFAKAVSDWDDDRRWFQSEVSDAATRFAKAGFKR